MLDMSMITFCVLAILLLLFFVFALLANPYSSKSKPNKLPRSYPLYALLKNQKRFVQWGSEILNSSPSLTFALQVPLSPPRIFTANPSNFKHILKTRFHSYQKEDSFRSAFSELFGDSLFLADGKEWKLQRQLVTHEFNTSSFQRLNFTTTDKVLSNRLCSVLSSAAVNRTVLDLQEVFGRFTFDTICQSILGLDLEILLPSFPKNRFTDAFEHSVKLGTKRYVANVFSTLPLSWKVKRFFDIGTEKQLRLEVNEVREFIGEIIRKRKKEMTNGSSMHNRDDILSQLLIQGHSNEKFLSDMLIALILAGQETVATALTWYFWLISQNPQVENEIVKEIHEHEAQIIQNQNGGKGMDYIHASLCESMRLYPPVPMNTKEAMADDEWPDGTKITKGMKITYHIYAMGRSKEVWGSDWAEFRPERWLETDTATRKWRFVARDPFTYPVFHAGPRVCLGREISMIQMKMVVTGVLRRFRVVPAVEDFEPIYIVNLTSKMKNGFPVRVEERAGKHS